MTEPKTTERCPRCGSDETCVYRHPCDDGTMSYPTRNADPWHSQAGQSPQCEPFSKGYKDRYGDPVSNACGDGKHSECPQDYIHCHCTYRGLHTTPHAYANVPFKAEAGQSPQYMGAGNWAAHQAEPRQFPSPQDWRKMCIVEIAAENQSVSDYIEHWEGRTLTAETRVRELEEALRACVKGERGSYDRAAALLTKKGTES